MRKKTLALMVLFLLSITTGISTGVAFFYARENADLRSQLVQNTQTPVPPTSQMLTTKVYFSKTPDSYETDFAFVVGVNREINSISPVETVMDKFLQGPSAEEAITGLKNPVVLTGASNCSGEQYRIVSNLTQLGTDLEIHFCKNITVNGAGDLARIQSTINRTLIELETSANYSIGRIAILDMNGNCLGDESGMNACLN